MLASLRKTIGILLACAVGLALTLTYCTSSNQFGDRAASGTGDISNPPAERRRPDEAILARCGDGAFSTRGTQVLLRAPYLQKVTSQEAWLMWTGVGGERFTVDLTDEHGQELASIPAQVDEGGQYMAKLDGLSPATTYCYKLKEGDTDLMALAGFRSAPATGSLDRVSFVAFGDSGNGGPDQLAVYEQLETVPFDLILHTGDVATGVGTLEELEADFFAIYSPLIRSIPAFPSSGNHDYETDDAKPFRQVFMLPENGAPTGRERWYSFDWGQVHFVALDTERVSGEQASWLEGDLAKNTLPWVVVYGHRPPYSSGEHGSDMAVREAFGPILERYRVALVLSGHDHDYERVQPQGGVTYVVTGGGGRGTRPVGSSGFTAFSEAVLHFVYVTVDTDVMAFHAIDATGREFDSAMIRRR